MTKTIYIQVTFDAEGIMSKYGKNTYQGNPTGIAHNFGHMRVTSNAMSGSGTGEFTFSALAGNVVRLFGATASNNFENMALIYDMPRFHGDDIFTLWRSYSYTKDSVSPNHESRVPPAIVSEQEFWFQETDVKKNGTGDFRVYFVLYNRDPLTNQPVVYGYFTWETTITVLDNY